MSNLLHSDIHHVLEQLPREQTQTYFIYALADAAQDSLFLKKFSHLSSRNLLTEAAGDKAAEISPHLIQLSSCENNAEWNYIEKRVVGTPRMTLIVSALSFDELYAHLRQFLNVKFDGGLEMYLAFWDPAILGTLIGQETDETLYVKKQVLSAEQKKILLEPIYSWWYWDRLGQLQRVDGRNQNEFTRFYDWHNPFQFTSEQEALMVEATFPDHLIYFLKLNNPFLVEGFKDWDLYQYVIEQISKAREYALEGTRDILNLICLTLIYQELFEQDTVLQNVLKKVKDKRITMDQAMEEIEDLEQVS